MEIQRRDQEILAMAAKMKALEEQHQDYQRHIAVLKESLCAKEEHYSMLQTDVSYHTSPIQILYIQFILVTKINHRKESSGTKHNILKVVIALSIKN